MSSVMFVLVFGTLGVFLYFVPSIIAYKRERPNKGSVLVLNVFLGWTFLGWVLALAMAAGGSSKAD